MKRKRKRVREKSVRAVILTDEEVLRKSMEHRDFIWFECVKEKKRCKCGSQFGAKTRNENMFYSRDNLCCVVIVSCWVQEMVTSK